MTELSNIATLNLALGQFASDDFVAGVLWALDTAYAVAWREHEAGNFTEHELATVQSVTDTGMERAGIAFGVSVDFQYTPDAKEIS